MMSEATETSGARMPVHTTDHDFCKVHTFPNSIPMSVLDAERARLNHAQTLEQIAEAGGMSLIEMFLNLQNLDLRQGAALNLTNNKILPRLRELIGRRLQAAIRGSQDAAIRRSLDRDAQTLSGGQGTPGTAAPERCGWTPEAQAAPLSDVLAQRFAREARRRIIVEFLAFMFERGFTLKQPGIEEIEIIGVEGLDEPLRDYFEQAASDASPRAQEAAGAIGAGSAGECLHPNFCASVNVARITPEGTEAEAATHFYADIKIECVECNTPFSFVGVSAGLSPREPRCDPFGLELRAPIKPGALTVPLTHSVYEIAPEADASSEAEQ